MLRATWHWLHSRSVEQGVLDAGTDSVSRRSTVLRRFDAAPGQMPVAAASPLERTGLHQVSLGWHLLFLFGVVWLLIGSSVPNSNEYIYLPAAYKQWHPDAWPGDWTFGHSLRTHLVFNVVVGLPMLVLPLEVVAWAGRLLTWTLALYAMLRLGTRLGVGLPLTTATVLLWLLLGQTVVGGEWLFGTFEAKVVAYVFLLFALLRFLDERWLAASALLGLAISFHPGLGVTAAVGVAAGALALRWSWRLLPPCAAVLTLTSLPGLLPVLLMEAGGTSADPEAWRFIALTVMPYHFDPFSFHISTYLALAGILAFCTLYALSSPRDPALRFLAFFLLGLAAVFGYGLVARATQDFAALRIMPFRLLPLLGPIVFLLFWFRMLRAPNTPRYSALLVVGTATLLLCTATIHLKSRALTFPVIGPQLAQHRGADTLEDWHIAFDWVASNTPAEASFVLPPWMKDASYRTQRAQVAMFDLILVQRSAEWFERIEALVGPVRALEELSASERTARIHQHYRQRTEAEIREIGLRYGADHIVTERTYAFDELFRSGSVRVYRIPS